MQAVLCVVFFLVCLTGADVIPNAPASLSVRRETAVGTQLVYEDRQTHDVLYSADFPTTTGYVAPFTASDDVLVLEKRTGKLSISRNGQVLELLREVTNGAELLTWQEASVVVWIEGKRSVKVAVLKTALTLWPKMGAELPADCENVHATVAALRDIEAALWVSCSNVLYLIRIKMKTETPESAQLTTIPDWRFNNAYVTATKETLVVTDSDSKLKAYKVDMEATDPAKILTNTYVVYSPSNPSLLKYTGIQILEDRVYFSSYAPGCLECRQIGSVKLEENTKDFTSHITHRSKVIGQWDMFSPVAIGGAIKPIGETTMKYIYWLDGISGRVSRVVVTHEPSPMTLYKLMEGIQTGSTPSDIAISQEQRTFFWSDYSRNTLMSVRVPIDTDISNHLVQEHLFFATSPPHSIDYDSKRSKLFWSEPANSRIRMLDVATKSVVGDLQFPASADTVKLTGIAYSNVTSRVYVADESGGRILSWGTDHSSTEFKREWLSANVEIKPKRLAVDPNRKVVYFVDRKYAQVCALFIDSDGESDDLFPGSNPTPTTKPTTKAPPTKPTTTAATTTVATPSTTTTPSTTLPTTTAPEETPAGRLRGLRDSTPIVRVLYRNDQFNNPEVLVDDVWVVGDEVFWSLLSSSNGKVTRVVLAKTLLADASVAIDIKSATEISRVTESSFVERSVYYLGGVFPSGSSSFFWDVLAYIVEALAIIILLGLAGVLILRSKSFFGYEAPKSASTGYSTA